MCLRGDCSTSREKKRKSKPANPYTTSKYLKKEMEELSRLGKKGHRQEVKILQNAVLVDRPPSSRQKYSRR